MICRHQADEALCVVEECRAKGLVEIVRELELKGTVVDLIREYRAQPTAPMTLAASRGCAKERGFTSIYSEVSHSPGNRRLGQIVHLNSTRYSLMGQCLSTHTVSVSPGSRMMVLPKIPTMLQSSRRLSVLLTRVMLTLEEVEHPMQSRRATHQRLTPMYCP